MSKIQIVDLNVEQIAALTENEAATIQGGLDPTTGSAALLFLAVAGVALASPVVIVAGAAASIIASGIAISNAIE
ncbi:MAG: hypothetical protein HC836_28750 [Richelia sp. RM2_1_2]|nr:hypothetical protein [Richelia sp. SM2_1_7]NJN07796.1 hypothetical protein [Richelia sp. RM1_1_1]NJO28948.1 hypothetical protein [Richelia sp. SL_2_1]NJO62078.1 hypothetical protein [Richelia sp. RM2_1_2]